MPEWLKNLWGGNDGAVSGYPMGSTWNPDFSSLGSFGAAAPAAPAMQGFSLSGPAAGSYVPSAADLTAMGGGAFNTSNWNTPAVGGSSGGLGGWLSNGQNLGTVIQGFGTLANAYMGFQQLKNAKANLAFQKDAYNTNLINSTQNYNTSLEDRIRGRTSAYEGKEADVQAYLAKHSLKPPAKK